jgi:hypothetical protein
MFRRFFFVSRQPFVDEVDHLLTGQRVPDAVAGQKDVGVQLWIEVESLDVRHRRDHLLLKREGPVGFVGVVAERAREVETAVDAAVGCHVTAGLLDAVHFRLIFCNVNKEIVQIYFDSMRNKIRLEKETLLLRFTILRSKQTNFFI